MIRTTILCVIFAISSCTARYECCIRHDEPAIDPNCKTWFTGCELCEVTEDGDLGTCVDGGDPDCCAYPYDYCAILEFRMYEDPQNHPPPPPKYAPEPSCLEFKEYPELGGYDLFVDAGDHGGECAHGFSFNACHEACNHDKECLAFDYNRETRSCCLWKEMLQPLEPMYGTATYVSYTADCPDMDGFTDTGDGWVAYPGLGRNGGNCMDTNYTAPTCANRCYEDENCIAFDWLDDVSCCFWDEPINGLAIWPGLCTYVTYALEEDCPEISEYDLYTELGAAGGRCFPSRLRGCESRCEHDPSCIGFDWIHGNCCTFSEIDELQVWPGLCTYVSEGTPVILPSQ